MSDVTSGKHLLLFYSENEKKTLKIKLFGINIS